MKMLLVDAVLLELLEFYELGWTLVVLLMVRFAIIEAGEVRREMVLHPNGFIFFFIKYTNLYLILNI